MTGGVDGNGGADYSDFEYQHFVFEHNLQPEAEPNARSAVLGNINVLQGSGGLDNNEVAELVYFELQPDIEVEDETGNQNAATNVELRGLFGANLPAREGITGSAGSGSDTDGDVISEREPGSTAFVRFNNELVEDRIFQQFATYGVAAFDRGDGGGGTPPNTKLYEKHYRNVTGRGPVLDSTDDLSINTVLIAGDIVTNFTGQVRCSMIWDTAEVSDAGRAFSVPSDD